MLLDDNLLEVALLNVGWLLASPEALNFINLMALVVVHKAFHQIQDHLGFNALRVEVALLQVTKQTFAVAAAVKQSLETFGRDLWLVYAAQVELVEVCDELALV